MKLRILIISLICFWGGLESISQNTYIPEKEKLVQNMIDSLLENPTSFFNNNDKNWRLLCDNLHQMDKATLDDITNTVYSGSGAIIENGSEATEGVI